MLEITKSILGEVCGDSWRWKMALSFSHAGI